jgi:FAD/FMN-containing dehydrogenase
MGINRRSFLQLGGLGATAAVLAACSSGGGAVPTSSTSTLPTSVRPTTAPVSTSTGPVAMDYPALARKLSGHLLTPDASGYRLASRSYNPLYDSRRPAAVALCARTEDVQACVSAAAASRTPIAARSGGHSYAGFSTPDNAMVVDLAGLSGVRVGSDGTAVVGAGTRLIDVYSALAGAGRALPAGSCPSVGVAGLTLGGGIGVLGRKYGLTCDHLVGATVVTADGQARTVSASSEPDLFWALRGGGGGNFGIVTSFTFSTVPAPSLTLCQLSYPSGAVTDAFGAWQTWLASAPDEMWSNVNITGGSPSTCTISGCYVGSSGGMTPLVDDLIRRIGSQPSHRLTQSRSYLDTMRFYAGCASESTATCQARTSGADWDRESFVASSRMLSAPVSDAAKVATAVDGRPDMHLIIDGLGGAVGRVAPTATAFPHRSAVASMQIYLKTTSAARTSAARSVGEVRDDLTGAVGSSAYVNYIDAAMPDWATAYYGANLTRLRSVAHQYDPDGLFTFAQGLSR